MDLPEPGRTPPVSAEITALIGQLATENNRRGHQRIQGELLKLGYQVSASTIRRVLKALNIPPRFLAQHGEHVGPVVDAGLAPPRWRDLSGLGRVEVDHEQAGRAGRDADVVGSLRPKRSQD